MERSGRENLEEISIESKELYVGVEVIKDVGGKEMQGEDIATKELDTGARNNDKKDNLWIQFVAIEQERKDKLEGMKTNGVMKDSNLDIATTKEKFIIVRHEELAMEVEWLEKMLDVEVECETEMGRAAVVHIDVNVMQMYNICEFVDMEVVGFHIIILVDEWVRRKYWRRKINNKEKCSKKPYWRSIILVLERLCKKGKISIETIID